MDFEKKYYLTQRPGEFVLVRWTRGHKDVEVYYKDQLLGRLQDAARLKRGVFVESPDLGKIELTLTESPMTIQVIVDGYHSKNNSNHPALQLKASGMYFTMIAVFAAIGTLFEGYRYSNFINLAVIVTFINLVILAIYIVSAIFVRKSKPWAFYLGFSTFSFLTLLTVLVLFADPNLVSIIAFLVRLAFQVILITNIKHAVATAKHDKFGSRDNDMLLDNF
jgi:hypothetical protein